MPDPKGLVLSNQANNTVGKHNHSYSSFDESLSYRFANTLRFGEYVPSFVMEGVESDEISLNSLDKIDSLSLKAPFKGTIRKIKESFKVPMMAILPQNWDRIYLQPSNGDDVPKDANCVIQNFPDYCKRYFTNIYNIVRSQLVSWNSDSSSVVATNITTFYTALMRTLVIGEYMYSAGSLLHVSGYRFNSSAFNWNTSNGLKNYDLWFDAVVSKMFANVNRIDVSYTVGGVTHNRSFKGLSANSNPVYEDFRSFLELYRENVLITVGAISHDFQTEPDLADDLAQYQATGEPFDNSLYWIVPSSTNQDLGDDVTALNPTTLNLSRILSYQLVCAHFYSNSSIDFIYSAELYRQYIMSLFKNYQLQYTESILDGLFRFTWNGMKMDYDVLSGHILSQLLFFTGTSWHSNLNWTGEAIWRLGAALVPGNKAWLGGLAAWPAIFGFRKSLRYGDYFTGSRPRPLAPINTDVSVANNAVSVVDITRNIQAQRFANSVMRSRSKIEEYVKSLFGKSPAPDYHNPFFLSRETEPIFGDEVQNTGASQASEPNSRTANFSSNVGQYTFTFRNDDMHPCVYLQIISFDIRRAYTRSVDRQMLHIDRYDMFNPDFQYIGDQPVYGIELGYTDGSGLVNEVFAYQSRDMEYKQRFDVASGGFAAEQLPGWILTDKERSRVAVMNLDPDFIRSYNTELDQFFLSLSGYSLGTYFHFVCITSNNVRAKRAMAVDPQILA